MPTQFWVDLVSAGDQLMFTVASDGELNELAAGMLAGSGVPWPEIRSDIRIPSGCTGVLWRESNKPTAPVRPLALVINDADRQRLFGRFSQLHSDLSPLSAWCHVLTPQRFEVLDHPFRMPDLGGLEASWIGLIVAEAMVLAGAPAAKLRTHHCFATQSWAVARSRALWPKTAIDEACDRLYAARRLARSDEVRLVQLRQPLQPVWMILAAASVGGSSDPALQPLVAAVNALASAREVKDEQEVLKIAEPIASILPAEARLLRGLPSMEPEDRLHLFDLLVDQLSAERTPPTESRGTALAFIAGYIATVAAGGSASFSLATDHAQNHPQIAAWAYILGGVGEHVTWTSSFDGLGRLVARALLRPFRLNDQPECDFALDEGALLADHALSDPLVHLRIKQGRHLTIAIFPGVDVTVPASEPVTEARPNTRLGASDRSPPRPASKSSEDELLGSIAELVWARLEPRFNREMEARRHGSRESSSRSSGSKRKTKASRELTLPLSKEPR